VLGVPEWLTAKPAAFRLAPGAQEIVTLELRPHKVPGRGQEIALTVAVDKGHLQQIAATVRIKDAGFGAEVDDDSLAFRRRLTDIGSERELNEDSFYYRAVQSSDEGPLGLFAVADGMGGELAGEVASRWAVQTLKRELAPLFRPRTRPSLAASTPRLWPSWASGVTIHLEETDLARLLEHAVERANQVLLGYARQRPDQAGGMGSTLTLAIVEDRRLTVVHVGDSRAYLWRDGQLSQLTEDHSVPGRCSSRARSSPTRYTPIPIATCSTAAWSEARRRGRPPPAVAAPARRRSAPLFRRIVGMVYPTDHLAALVAAVAIRRYLPSPDRRRKPSRR